MAATFLGTAAVLGLTAQTGFILQSHEKQSSVERKWVMDPAGEKVGLAMWGDEFTHTLEGLKPSSSAFSTRLAVKLTLANTLTDFGRAAPASGFGDDVLVGMTERVLNSDFHTFTATVIGSPFMDAGA